MRTVRIGGVHVGVHWGTAPLLLIYCVFGELTTLFAALLTLFLHELAHALAARRLGVTVHALTLYPFGAEARIDQSALLPTAEGIVALAGPVCNFVMAGMLAVCLRVYPSAESALLPFYRVNMALGVFNLLPAYPLDGGRVLRCLIAKAASYRTACRITAFLSLAVACLLLAAAATATLLGLTMWGLYAAGAFLLLAAIREILSLPEAQAAAAAKLTLAVQTGQSVPIRFSAAHQSMQAASALADMRQKAYHVLRVLDDGMHTVGELDERTLLMGLYRLGDSATVGQIAALFDRGQKM